MSQACFTSRWLLALALPWAALPLALSRTVALPNRPEMPERRGQLWAQLPAGGDGDRPIPDAAPPDATNPDAPLPDPVMPHHSVQVDPLNSPYPVPWSWVLATQAESTATNISELRYYRSPALVSPDGQYAAYSRIQMQAIPNFTQSQVSSVLFLENLQTGGLKTITATSPLANNPFLSREPSDRSGMIAILIPVAWSELGERVLAREFESLFGSDIASDYAVVWDRQLELTRTLAPTDVVYTNAVLMGWSQTYPGQVLFQAGDLGQQEPWPLWAVNMRGQTIAVRDDQPIVFGQTVNNVWAGPQSHR